MKEMLNEASLGRLKWHMKQEHPFIIVSACRGDMTKAEKYAKTKEMRRDILKVYWFSFNRAKGHYIETQDDGTEKSVHELSTIMYGSKEREKELRRDGIHIGNVYKQDSILFCNSKGHAYLIYTRDFMEKGIMRHIGDMYPLGEFSTRALGNYYTEIGKRFFKFDMIENRDIGYLDDDLIVPLSEMQTLYLKRKAYKSDTKNLSDNDFFDYIRNCNKQAEEQERKTVIVDRNPNDYERNRAEVEMLSEMSDEDFYEYLRNHKYRITE